jgi:DNA-binding NarL/FixJ family response regulator
VNSSTPSANPLVRVLIVDDVPAVREGLRLFLEDQPGLAVVGEAHDGRAALAVVSTLRPDVVLMDIEMPGGDGLAATRAIKALEQPPAIVIMSVYADEKTRALAFSAGADRFIEKTAALEEVAQTLRHVLRRD